MIRKKNKEEIKVLREGGKVLAHVVEAISEMIKPGVNTKDLEKKAEELMLAYGGRSSFKNLPMPDGRKFPSILCTSIDDEVVHAPSVPGRELKKGQIVKVDIGMEYPISESRRKEHPVNIHSAKGGFYTDMAKTFIVGEASKEASRLVKTARECLDFGIQEARPGRHLNDIGTAIESHAKKSGFSVVREMVGHGVGHEVHEAPQVPHYSITDGSLKDYELEAGMVIAIEPMINSGDWPIREGEDGFTWLTRDGGLSAQFEHTIFISKNGPEILTLV